MKHLKMKKLLILLFSLFLGNALFSQISPAAAVKAWDNMTTMVVETAKAMPAEHYSYKPTAELRDFAEQMGHTTGANYLFASVVGLHTPDPMPTSESKKKDQVIKELQASFAFIKGGMQKLSPTQLNEEIDFFGSKMPRLQAILIMTSHLQREQGKSTIYTRLKGIAPGGSAGW